MRIGVISDTHIPKAALDLPEVVYNDLVKCDLILHAGDIVQMDLLLKLQKLAPVRAVYGNMDLAEVKENIPQKDVVKVDGVKIAIMHGYGTPKGLVDVVKGSFPADMNAIVFGHSHMPINEIIGKTLFFNPGSPTDTIFAPYNSYGILEVDKKKITGHIIRIT